MKCLSPSELINALRSVIEKTPSVDNDSISIQLPINIRQFGRDGDDNNALWLIPDGVSSDKDGEFAVINCHLEDSYTNDGCSLNVDDNGRKLPIFELHLTDQQTLELLRNKELRLNDEIVMYSGDKE